MTLSSGPKTCVTIQDRIRLGSRLQRQRFVGFWVGGVSLGLTDGRTGGLQSGERVEAGAAPQFASRCCSR